MTPIEWGFAVVFAAGCLAAAGVDIAQRKIPNLICLGLLLAGIAQVAVLGAGMAWAWHLGLAVVSLLVGMLLFWLGWFGAGDSKFLTAVSIWFPLADGPRLITWIALSGLGVFLGWFAWRRFKGLKISRSSDSPFEKLPYGVAIAAGALITAFQ